MSGLLGLKLPLGRRKVELSPTNRSFPAFGERVQERILGFAFGLAGGVGVFIYEQKHLWRSTGGVAEVFSGGQLPPPKIFVSF